MWMAPESPTVPEFAMSMLLLSVVWSPEPALYPMAMLVEPPPARLPRAPAPSAVFPPPPLFSLRASRPIATLLLSVVPDEAAPLPTAVLWVPLVLDASAMKPDAVLSAPERLAESDS